MKDEERRLVLAWIVLIFWKSSLKALLFLSGFDVFFSLAKKNDNEVMNHSSLPELEKGVLIFIQISNHKTLVVWLPAREARKKTLYIFFFNKFDREKIFMLFSFMTLAKKEKR